MGKIYFLGRNPSLPGKISTHLSKEEKIQKTREVSILSYSSAHNFSQETISEWREILVPLETDVLFFSEPPQKNKHTLFAFDMDSTLIKQEIIDEIARRAGVYEQVSKITEEAMQGNLDFETSLRRRCQLLRGAGVGIFREVYSGIELNHGVGEFLEDMKILNAKKIVLSGGFVQILSWFTSEYEFDDFRANILIEKDGFLTGEVSGEIIDSNKKKEYLNYFKGLYGVEQVIAIGDGANDHKMLNSAHYGIGFKPKRGLKKEIQNWIEFSPLYAILAIME